MSNSQVWWTGCCVATEALYGKAATTDLQGTGCALRAGCGVGDGRGILFGGLFACMPCFPASLRRSAAATPQQNGSLYWSRLSKVLSGFPGCSPKLAFKEVQNHRKKVKYFEGSSNISKEVDTFCAADSRTAQRQYLQGVLALLT